VLHISYKYIIESGFFLNVKFHLYKNFTFNKLVNSFYGISEFRIMYYIKRLEYQVKLNRYKLPNITNKRFLFFYKVINYYILKILPIYYKFSSIRNLNIIRK